MGAVDLASGEGAVDDWDPNEGGGGGRPRNIHFEKIVLCNQCKLCDPPFRRGNLSKIMEKRTYKINCLKVVTCKNQTLLLVNNANCVVPVFQGADMCEIME